MSLKKLLNSSIYLKKNETKNFLPIMSKISKLSSSYTFKNKIFPLDFYKSLSNYKIGGMLIKKNNYSFLKSSLIIEKIAYNSVSAAAYLSIHNFSNLFLYNFGNNFQKNEITNDLTNFKKFITFCLSEKNAGSDVFNLETNYKKKKDYFIINGNKFFLSGALIADYFIILARNDKNTTEISAFLIPKKIEGLKIGKDYEKLGWNTNDCSKIFFDNLLLEKKYLIGEEGKGGKYALDTLTNGRLNVTTCPLGGAIALVDQFLPFVFNGRKGFGFGKNDFGFEKRNFVSGFGEKRKNDFYEENVLNGFGEDQGKIDFDKKNFRNDDDNVRNCFDKDIENNFDEENFKNELFLFNSIDHKNFLTNTIEKDLGGFIIDIVSCRNLIHTSALALENNDKNKIDFVAMAKYKTTDLALKIVNRLSNMSNFDDFMYNSHFNNIYCDLRAHTIAGGTNEILRLILGKNIFADKL